ncbi:hypothetical protein R3P38DRAFT_2571584 [Favolaschia claudopus]|uniref:Ubiquitin-like protease family profile domain-containing protein n=1 Tax=Favolaschia claudopus TaxID=2862362 RepID=A0AAV9ZT49_9AGAR
MAAVDNTSKIHNCIGQGKTLATAPADVKKYLRELFALPQALEATLLPSPYISIAELLNFRLPFQNASSNVASSSEFLSTAAPDPVDRNFVSRLQLLNIPDTKTINRLVTCSRQSALDGARSLIYRHIGGSVTRFPLYTLTFWAAQKNISKINPSRAELANHTGLLLASLPWGLPKCGLSNSDPFHTLWRFLGPNWLTDSQMGDMLELLRHVIITGTDLVKNTRPSGTVLVRKILDAYRVPDRDCAWVRDIGDDLVHNHGVLITAVHLGPVTNEPHWVAVVFDCRDKPTIRFGDSLGAPIPVELLTALTWWLSEHSPNEAAYAKLPIAPQDDGHSCGLLVANALVHFVDDSITLDAPMLAVNLRLESFNRIATWGLEEVCFISFLTFRVC